MEASFIRQFKLSPYAKCWALKRTPDGGTQVKVAYKIIKAAKKAEKIIADAEKEQKRSLPQRSESK